MENYRLVPLMDRKANYEVILSSRAWKNIMVTKGSFKQCEETSGFGSSM